MGGTIQKRTHLQIMFTKECFVAAIGTWGAGKGYDYMSGGYSHPQHYVTSYRLHYITDEDSTWKPVRDDPYEGNSRPDKHKINDLRDPHSGAVGLVCKGLRITPGGVSRNDTGFVGAKTMRVAIYGNHIMDDADDVKARSSDLVNDTFAGTVVTVREVDEEAMKTLPRKTREPRYSPEWTWSKPKNKKEKRDYFEIKGGVTLDGTMKEIKI